MLVVLFALPTLAYESDSLTDRVDPLPDVTAELDARVNEIVLDAIEVTNARTQCLDADPERVKRHLARAIHVRASANELVGERGGLRAFGFDRFSAWIEKGGVPSRSFNARNDIFGSTLARESPLLRWAGVCSTVRVNDVLTGTDKLDHFFEEGYAAWRKSGEGVNPEAAIEWMTRTENTKYGLRTSETFSWGDLAADWDGMAFYDELLEPHSVAVLGVDGCLEPGEPFSWADWVTWEYDEVLNPPRYTPSTQRGVERHLRVHREQYCEEYAVWGGEAYEAHLAQIFATPAEYASPEAPERVDPYQLKALCDARWVPPPAED